MTFGRQPLDSERVGAAGFRGFEEIDLREYDIKKKVKRFMSRRNEAHCQ